MNLLIVNDAALTVTFLATQISWSEHGIFHVSTAYSADSAKKILLAEPIDILLCDIEMPGEDGLELAHWIKNNNLFCDCIFLTCHANFEYIHEALHLECRDYIIFPAPAETITSAVEKVIQRRVERFKNSSLQEYGKQWVEMHYSDPQQSSLSTSQDIISNTIHYILENIDSPDLSVNEIAEKNFLSLSYLSRLFKKAKGISISQYIIRQRMQLASQLLIETNNTISNISLCVGYNNYPYFTSTFHKYWHVTPSQYREEHQVVT